MNRRFYTFLSTICVCCLVFNCQRESHRNLKFECSNFCDSISYEYNKDRLVGIYSYYNGQKIGKYILLNNDTTFGFDEFAGDYFKRTSKSHGEKKTLVELYKIKNGEYKISERIVLIDDSIDDSNSHYILTDLSQDTLSIESHLKGSYDHIIVHSGNDVIFHTDSAIRNVSFYLDPVSSLSNLTVYYYEVEGIDSSGNKVTQGTHLSLSEHRIIKQNELFAPDKWVLTINNSIAL